MEIATARLEVQQLRQGEPAALVTYTQLYLIISKIK